MNKFIDEYITESSLILNKIDHNDIENVISYLKIVKDEGGRLFIMGCGGSAGTASHAVNDFRKLCSIEAYTPTDNASELTARINDEGWESCYAEWLKASRFNDLPNQNDAILILSVGGGSEEKQISMNLVNAVKYANIKKATVLGIVGKDGGYTNSHATACIIIPPIIKEKITPHTEGLCSVILHLIVSDPSLKSNATKWESVK